MKRCECIGLVRDPYGFLMVVVMLGGAWRSWLVEDVTRGRRAVYVHPSQWPSSSAWPRRRAELWLPH